MRRFLLLAAVGAAIGLALASCSVWLYREIVQVPTVGDSTTLEETAECLTLYATPESDRAFSVYLDRGRVEACFPPQTAAGATALIGCFNTYERAHRKHFDWPGANLRACPWDGATPSPSIATVRLGTVVARPAPPRAGRRVVLEIGTREADAETIHEAVESDTIEVVVRIQGAEPADLAAPPIEYGLDPDGKLRVSAVVPDTAAGKRLLLELTLALDSPSEVTTITAFPIAP